MSLLFLHYTGRTELQPSPLDSKLDLASMAFSEAFSITQAGKGPSLLLSTGQILI